MKQLATQTPPPQKLPDEEWNFNDVPGESDDFVRGIFLYEYFRHSSKLRQLVLRCREGLAPIWSPLSVLDEQWIRGATDGNEGFFPLVQYLKSCPAFPDLPALRILKNGYPGAVQEDSGIIWLTGLGSLGAVRLYGRETMAWESKTQEGFSRSCAQLTNESGIEYRFIGNVQAQSSESIFPLGLNWLAPDDQIVDEIRTKVLSRRPDQFRHLAKIPSKQIAFGKFIGKLAFKPVSALNWLGTLRRFQAAGNSWDSFLELYDQSAKADIDKSYRDFFTWRQNQMDKRDKAMLVLEWLENGASQPLDPKGFQ